MSEQLIVRLGANEHSVIHWLVWSTTEQEIIASGELQDASGLASLKQRAGNRPVLALVPTSDVLLKWVTLPNRSRKAIAAIPYMLEDELNTDVDDLFFALGPKLQDQQAVAIVSLQKMQQWTQLLDQADLACQAIIPDTLALPISDHRWSLMPLGDQWLVKQDLWQGIQGESSWLLAAMEYAAKQQQQPVQVECFGEIPSVNLANIEFVAADIDMPLKVLATGAIDASFNLLQGEFKPRKQTVNQSHKWRLAASLAAVALVLTLVDKGIEVSQLNQQKATLKAQIEQQYQRAFPNGGRYRNIKSHMSKLLNELQKNGGDVSMLLMLSQLSQAFTESSVQPQNFKFDQGRAEIRMLAVAQNFNALEKFKTLAQQAGFDVQQGAINNKGSQVTSSLTLKG